MSDPFHDYLKLLEQLQSELERLSELARQKILAVRNYDLVALDQILRQEQALSLAFRGLEKRQTDLLAAMGLKDVHLSSIADSYPAAMQQEAQQMVDSLRTQYDIYHQRAETARTMLESGLLQIEKVLAGADVTPPTAAPGYHPQPTEPEPPPSMKTDFRA